MVIAMILLILILILFWDLRHYTSTIRVRPGIARVAGPGFERQLRYHGILSARWDWIRGTWVFVRDGQVCKLKTRVRGG